MDEQRRRVESFERPLTGFDASHRGFGPGGARPVFEVALSHAVWAGRSFTGTGFQRERLDLAVRGAQVFAGARVHADLSVEQWTQRPEGARFPVSSATQLWVRQLELAYRPVGQPFAFAAGRSRPRHAPGLYALDGAHASWRSADGETEVGAYGGALPDAVSWMPSFGQWTAGVYARSRLLGPVGVLQPEARVGVVNAPSASARWEAQAALHGWFGPKLDAHLDALLGPGAASEAGPLRALRLDVGTRVEPLRARVSARYSGGTGLYSSVLPLDAAHALHADGVVSADVPGGWVVGVQGGVARDLATLVSQGRVGPELSSPALWGGRAGVGLGYSEELGWMRGRSGHLQASLFPSGRLRVFARGSFFQQLDTDAAAGMATREAGLSLSGDAWITRILWVRLTGLGRFQLAGPERSAPFGLSGTLQLGASL